MAYLTTENKKVKWGRQSENYNFRLGRQTQIGRVDSRILHEEIS